MASGTIIAGASGFSFQEWKGTFYPQKIKSEAMLAYYAEHLPTVEINSSFYGMPKLSTLEKWVHVTPDRFSFSIKAPSLITHKAKLKAAPSAELLAQLYGTLKVLGDKRGPVLFQLPPYLRKDLPLLSEFLGLLPADHRAAFEFRNESWFADDVYDALKRAGAALCLSEREDKAPPPLIETAPWGYVRLRLESYSEADLRRWVKRLATTGWENIHAYFMHEPTAPAYAQSLMQIRSS